MLRSVLREEAQPAASLHLAWAQSDVALRAALKVRPLEVPPEVPSAHSSVHSHAPPIAAILIARSGGRHTSTASPST